MRPDDRANQALTDATLIATLIHTAIQHLNDNLNGYPETTPGAPPASAPSSTECPHGDCTNTRPCGTHEPDATIKLTTVERLATQPDKARTHLNLLTQHVTEMARHANIAATICHQWGLPGIDDTTIKAGLKERIAAIWCGNCAKAGLSTVRLAGRTECRFCEEVRQKGTCGVANPNHHPAPKALLEIHVRRRLNSADFTRCMTNAYGPNWNKKIKKGKAA